MPTADFGDVERRIARRFPTDVVLEIWIPKRGVLGRAKTALLPAADMSIFGASVVVAPSDGLKRGQVVQVSINGESTSAIVRNEMDDPDHDGMLRCGIEFVKPPDAFVDGVTEIINRVKALQGATASEEIWLRSA